MPKRRVGTKPAQRQPDENSHETDREAGGSTWDRTGGDAVLLVMSAAASELALDEKRCIEILRISGHLPIGPGFGIVNLWEIPEGLNARELERYLRRGGVGGAQET